MKKKKKRSTALPRLTLLAYSRRDLLAFTEAVEALRHIAADLRAAVDAMPRPRPKKPAQPEPVVTAVIPGMS